MGREEGEETQRERRTETQREEDGDLGGGDRDRKPEIEEGARDPEKEGTDTRERGGTEN